MNSLKDLINQIESLELEINTNIEMLSLVEEEQDSEIMKEISENSSTIKQNLENLKLLVLLSGPYDKNNCIIDIHPGAGGTESCDWASMLYRMYMRWCEKKKYKVTVLDYQEGEEAGIKSVSIQVKGLNAYGYLKIDKGVH